jgi:glycosyltransferase involved in cell wall biosynthesis
MRIAMLAPHPGTQGPLPKHTPILIRGLVGLDDQVDLIPWGKHADGEGPLARIAGRAADVVRVARQLVRSAPDVVVIKTGHDWRSLPRDIPLALRLRAGGIPVVVQFQGSRAHLLDRRTRVFFRVATRMLLLASSGALVLSTEEASDLAAFEPRRKYEVVRNPLVPGTPPVADPRRRADGEVVHFVFLGRLVAEKGVLDFVEALLSMRKAPWRASVFGDGPLAQLLRERVLAEGMDGRITVAGYVSGSALEDAYRAADVLVLPTYWPEGFPTVITESLVRGLGIITTQLRGARDALTDGVNAYFVEPQDVPSLAVAMLRCIDEPNELDAMKMANRELSKSFDGSVVAAQYRSALLRILATRSGATTGDE